MNSVLPTWFLNTEIKRHALSWSAISTLFFFLNYSHKSKYLNTWSKNNYSHCSVFLYSSNQKPNFIFLSLYYPRGKMCWKLFLPYFKIWTYQLFSYMDSENPKTLYLNHTLKVTKKCSSKYYSSRCSLRQDNWKWVDNGKGVQRHNQYL